MTSVFRHTIHCRHSHIRFPQWTEYHVSFISRLHVQKSSVQHLHPPKKGPWTPQTAADRGSQSAVVLRKHAATIKQNLATQYTVSDQVFSSFYLCPRRSVLLCVGNTTHSFTVEHTIKATSSLAARGGVQRMQKLRSPLPRLQS